MGGQSHRHPPLHAGLLTSCELSLDALLFTQFVQEITEKLGKTLGHPLITSSLIY